MTRKIGVFLPNWVGDATMATPALRALAHPGNSSLSKAVAPSRQNPSLPFRDAPQIVGIMQPVVSDLLQGLPWLDSRLVFTRKKSPHGGRISLISRIRKEKLDTILLFTNSLWTALVAKLAGVPRRIGYARDGRGWLLTDRIQPVKSNGKFVAVPAIEYYLRLAEQMNGSMNDNPSSYDRSMKLVVTPDEDRLADELYQLIGFDRSSPTVVINSSGAWGSAKLWPADYVEQLARRIVNERPWQVLIHCGPAESAAANAIAMRIDHPRVRSMGQAQELPIALTKAVLGHASVVVSTDSGPRHIAVALDRQVVSLFGPTNYEWTKTFNQPEHTLALNMNCRPCWKKTCPLGHHQCMRNIGVEQVFWKIVEAHASGDRELRHVA